jgi:hypothetical protein
MLHKEKGKLGVRQDYHAYIDMCIPYTYLSCEATEESKEKLREGKSKVFVEEVAKKRGHSVVRPLAVHQEKTL